MLPWLPLLEEHSSENDALLRSSVLPSFFFVFKARNGKRGEREEEGGETTSENEGFVSE